MEMPDWLKKAAKDYDPVLPWVPMLSDELDNVGVGVDFVHINNDHVTVAIDVAQRSPISVEILLA